MTDRRPSEHGARSRVVHGVLGTLLLLASSVPVGGAVCAQQRSLEARGGFSHARPPSGVEGDAGSYATLGLAWFGEPGAPFLGVDAGLGLSGLRGDWLSGQGGVEASRPLGAGMTGRLTLVGSAFAVGEPDTWRAVLVRLAPSVGGAWAGGAWETRLEARAGRISVGVIGDGGEGDEGTVAEGVWAAGGGASLRHALGPVGVGAQVDGRVTEPGTWWSGGAWTGVRAGPAFLRLEIEGWRSPAGRDETVGRVRIDVPLGRSGRSSTSAGRTAPDPLLGSAPGTFASTHVAWDLTNALGLRPAPVVEVLRRDSAAGVAVRFTVPDAQGGEVELLGDFSRWQPVAMRRAGDTWTVTLELEPGLYHFGFRRGGTWFVPEQTPGRTEDEWGRPTATLVVGPA